MLLLLVLNLLGSHQPPDVDKLRPPPDEVACPAYDASTLPAALPRSSTPSAGELPGSFAVSSDGRANYSMALSVPPGRLGMEPRLAISYDSGAGDGPVGVGFGLQATSAITRCASTVAQQGYLRAVQYDVRDALCWEGRPLVATIATGTTIEYRSFPDVHAKIVAHYARGADHGLGPTSWEVFTKEGHILEYGAASNSRAMATNSVIAAWWLATEKDRRGNAVDYTYWHDTDAEDGHTREILLERIDYTRHVSMKASRSVLFDYERTTVSTLYEGGLELTRSRLLKQVTMRTEPEGVVRSYHLTYGAGSSTKRPLLDAIKECAHASGPCKPETRFSWSSTAGGLSRHVTAPLVPSWPFNKFHMRWVLADVNGDGLDDLVMVRKSESVSAHDDWLVALNTGGDFAKPKLWARLPHPLTPSFVEHEDWTLTPMDFDQDGLTDILLDTPNPDPATWPHYRWLRALPNHTFELKDTAIPQPKAISFDPGDNEIGGPDGASPLKREEYRFMRLGDVNGDGVADLIQCLNPGWDVGGSFPDASKNRATWTVHLWVPSLPHGGGPGFDPTPISIPGLENVDCASGIKHTSIVDVDGDGASELMVKRVDNTYGAFRYDGTRWLQIPTNLPVQTSFRKIHFMDVNGDGLTDAVYTGYGYACDLPDEFGCSGVPHDMAPNQPQDVPYQALNSGKGFGLPVPSLAKSLVPRQNGLDWTDWFGDEAVSLDYNGDGRMDLLMPIKEHCGNDSSDACWVVLQSNPAVKGLFVKVKGLSAAGTMSAIDTHIPLVLDEQGIPAVWFLPQVTDADGNGRHDIVLPNTTNDGTFLIYKNGSAQDLLVGVTDGMNALDPGDAGFIPSVSIAYDTLIDRAVTHGLSGAERDRQTYLAHSDAKNHCAYPRTCVVGPARVVASFALDNGKNERRRFALRYRDGRSDRMGRGFLGFGERLLLDEDTGAGSADFYDNVTYDDALRVFPFVGQATRSWTWAPANPTQTAPTQIEMSFGRAFLAEHRSTLGHSAVLGTYFTMPSETVLERQEGTFKTTSSETLLDYVAKREKSPATLLGETSAVVTEVDAYGNVLGETDSAADVDLENTITRSVDNDPVTWRIGEVRTEDACSTALGRTQCRHTSLGYDAFGEVEGASVGDVDDPDTQLAFAFHYDAFGHVVNSTADDALGHHRSACVSFDPEGVFPYASRNALGHTTLASYDHGLGVLTALVDPNGLVTRWAHDGFGRITKELWPDGTATSNELLRNKHGGPTKKWWALQLTTSETGGATVTTELDSLGRPVHTSTLEALTESCGASHCAPSLRREQETTYDFLGRMVRVTLPWITGDSLTNALHEDYAYDAAGRVTKSTEPWGRVTTYTYANNIASASDWLGTTSTEVDALGRVIEVTDKKGGVTATTYGPFSAPWSVTRFGNETTTMERDAFGRVVRELDSDRGATVTHYDGFGDVRTIDDALARHVDFTYDALGRRVVRHDHDEAAGDATTTWEYDTAPHGIGRMASITSPTKHVDTYTYNALARLETHTLALAAGKGTFTVAVDYDKRGRPWHVTYPSAPDVAPLVVRREYDALDNLIAVRDDATGAAFWQLGQLDGAGRITGERLGNNVYLQREFAPSTGLLEHAYAQWWKSKKKHTTLQDLHYAYDRGLRMTSRADALQKDNLGLGARTEHFTHDALGRLTCTSLQAPTMLPKPGGKFQAPHCDVTLDYFPNGNIKAKSDVGTYAYDPAHPHAVSTAGNDGFGYDAVGNQIDRPGWTIAYTPFDLPTSYTGDDGSVVSFDYDGEQRRIRKDTPDDSTIYVDGLYERSAGDAVTAHRFYVEAGSATVVLTRIAGEADRIAFLVTDALGSVDVVTDDSGKILERRSYDAFGARRSPTWGQAHVGAFGSAVTATRGFTGHEADEELGLVNARGRIYDPRLGRFLQTDPIVALPGFTQSWNAYSYVFNSPLNFTDPSGFEPPLESNMRPPECGDGECRRKPGTNDWEKRGAVTPGGPKDFWRPISDSKALDAKDAGRDDAAAGRAANAASPPPDAAAASARTWRDLAPFRFAREFARGFVGGLIPGGAIADGLATDAGKLPRGTVQDQFGRAGGQYAGGATAQLLGGWLGGAGGVITGGSGGSAAAVGAPALAGAAVLIAGGATNQAVAMGTMINLLTTGSGSGSGTPASSQSEAPPPSGKGKAQIDPAKFKYLFGEAGGREHNVARTAQNAGQLARVGVYNNAEGQALLESHFNQVVQDPSDITRTWTNNYGTFQTRESLFVGPGGAVKLESTWQVLADGVSRLTTVIPFGG